MKIYDSELRPTAGRTANHIISGIALVLILLMVGGIALAEDPVAVRVGGFSYPKSVVQGALDSQLELSEMLQGDAPTEEEKKARLQSTVESFVQLGVIENKLDELGQNGFSDSEREELNKTARSQYEQLWQMLYQQMQGNDASVTEEDVTEQLEDMGYTFEAIYNELELQTRQNRAIDLFCGTNVLTQDQVDNYYEEQFVAPDRADYQDNISKYDQEILMNNNEAFYTPEGYRYIRQIVLEIPEAAKKAAKSEQIALNRATKSMAAALQELMLATTAAEGWDDIAEAKALYNESAAALTKAQSDYAARLEAEALPLIQENADEIKAQYEAGIDFKALINRYSTDLTERNLTGDGYPFHPDSKMWPENFRAAAAALEKPGDISKPVLTEQGVHIICYVGDVPAGAHVLTDDERTLLYAAALRYYQLEELAGMVEAWQADYEIETHPELLLY